MNNQKKRLIGYGSTTAVLAVLVFCGFVYSPAADTMTLFSSAEVHLKLAASMPATDASGDKHALRTKLLQDGRGWLEAARKQEPELFLGFEYAGWLMGLEGDYSGAAKMYSRAQSGEGSTRETRELDALNEARMWRAAGEPRKALAAIGRYEGDFSAANASKAMVEQMLACEVFGDSTSARSYAKCLVSTSKEPMALLDAGHYLRRANDLTGAAQAYAGAIEGKPIAGYYLARLKVGAQEFDTAMELLDRAMAMEGQLVRDMLVRDSATWKPLHGDERFRRLNLSAHGAATPGR
jgi:tetratricopeptide (TPR) repeat protein